jgi:hypothetical protein
MGIEDRPKIVDLEGLERDWSWLLAEFGAVELERAEVSAGQKKVYRLVTLEVAEGPAAQIVNVIGPDGRPLEGIHIVRSWPEAPELTEWAATLSKGLDRGVHGPTNAEGNLGFGLGRLDHYLPPAAGPGVIWVADQAAPSDVISGLGLLDGTDHRHVNLFFQLVDLDVAVPAPKALPGRKPFEQVPGSPSPATPRPRGAVEVQARSPSPGPISGAPLGPASTPPPAPASPVDDAWTVILQKLDLIADLLEQRLKE